MEAVMARLKGVGAATVGLCAMVVVVSMLAISSPTSAAKLALSPGSALLSSSRPWTLVTGCLMETSVLKLAVAVPAIAYLGRIIESRVTLTSYAAFLALTIVATGLAIAIGSVGLYFITYETGLLFDDIYGTFGVVEALAVGVFQLDPDGTVPNVPQLSHKHLPVVVLVTTLVLELLLGIAEDTALVSVSLVLSWTYLRFWQPRGESRGDWREEFSFSNMFPEAFRPPIDGLSRVVHSLLGRFWFFKQPAVAPPPLPTGVHHQDVEAPDVPMVVDPVAERRRARALKALNSRMASMGKPRGLKGVSRPAAHVGNGVKVPKANGLEGSSGPTSSGGTATPQAAAPPAAGAGAAVPATSPTDSTPSDASV